MPDIAIGENNKTATFGLFRQSLYNTQYFGVGQGDRFIEAVNISFRTNGRRTIY